MSMRKLFKQIVLTVTLLTSAGVAQAEEDDVCAAFEDGIVDESLLATMLSAAHDGHLYRIQQKSSQVGFCVDSKLSRIEGNFRDFRGGMALNPGESVNGQTMVLIRAASLDTEGALVRNLLKGESFFDVDRYPEVLFVSSGFQWTGPDTAVLKGDLTIRGITKHVVFNVTLTPLDTRQIGQSEKILVKASTTINRADFGMNKLDSVVNSDVRLCMSVEAQKYTSLGRTEAGTSLPFADNVIAPVPALLDRPAG